MGQEYNKKALEKYRVYRVTIIKVTNERNKSFIPPGTQTRKYVWDIYSQDANGSYQSEYLSDTPGQEVFFENAVQFIKCMGGNQYCDEIIPVDPDKEQHLEEHLKTIKKDTTINGTTYSCAIICAKDIMAAQIAANPGSEFTEKEKTQLFEIAEEIDNWLKVKRDL